MLAATSVVGLARADIAVSSNDSHTVLKDGVQLAPETVPPDTLTVLDLKSNPPRILTTIDAPGSVVGPPTAVAVAPDESFAIVTSATKADKSGQNGIAPDDRVSVVDLTANPPKIIQSLTAGAGATTVRIAPDGKLVLIVNRTAGTISVFTLADRHLTPTGTVTIGANALPSGLVFTKDGKSALVSRYGDHQISVLHVDGTAVTVDPRPITTGLSPYTMDVTADGSLAAVSNMGRGNGDVDTVSLIDLATEPFRAVQTVSAGRSPEGLRWSPDGKFLAIGAQDGSTLPAASPFVRDHGRLLIFALEGKSLRQVAEAPIGRWNQGIAFSRDGRTVLVQNMVERNIMVFGWDGKALTPGESLPIGSGPAAIMTSWP
ncbi:MAG: YncE family protein [Acetobacteraceae bacterium]|nr:YncE family protein [Acetobacteraceae bacterium]